MEFMARIVTEACLVLPKSTMLYTIQAGSVLPLPHF